jgi:hypothetical protein
VVGRGSPRYRRTPHSIFRRLLAWLAILWRVFVIAMLAGLSHVDLAPLADV